MNTFLGSFDANEYESQSFGALPNGDYEAILTDMEEKETKAGTGTYFKGTFQIIAGDHEGRMLWENFNVINPNKDAERIGRAQFADLCRAVGIIKPRELTELCNVPVVLVVKTAKDDPDKNVVKRYKAKESSTPHAPAKPKTVITDDDVPKAEPAKKAPWKR